MKIYEQIAQELQIQKQQVVNTVELIDTDNSIPFIARYRKEVTGNLDDAQLRYLEERLLYLRNLEARKADILRLIDQQEKLTPELRAQIEAATVLQQVEELYLPFRPKKRTRAT
ncbi:MAG TPA: RNA-binding transcriptional accessory protein, partial [Erysipelothrix sp.]|nr:RNA-binding transcriptional accessory protein [Erysipelothrix sp.]